MLKWIIRWLYNKGIYTPTSTTLCIDILLTIKISPYVSDFSIPNSVTKNILDSISVMEHAVSVDYYNTYAVSLNAPITEPVDTYWYRWCSVNNKFIPSGSLEVWLKLVKRLIKVHKKGLRSNKDSRAYANSIRLNQVVNNNKVIVNELLRVNSINR